MGVRLGNRVINRVGVVGSGNIGPDIALHFAKAFHAHGVPVIVVDVSPEALARGQAKAAQKIAKARESKAFTAEAADAMTRCLRFTGDYSQLADADLVIEAATENLEVKRAIFARLVSLCGPHAIIASNSSHIEPEELFGTLAGDARRRSLVIHYFFPADRNLLVEIVAGRDTDPALARAVTTMYEKVGKVPVQVRGRFGYAVNPVFEGLFLAAALAVEERLGTVKEVDSVARTALGLGVGPFTAMNLTGGNPITHHSLDLMTAKIGPWFRSPRLMHEAMASGNPWDVARRDEQVVVPPERAQRITDAMVGAYFGLAGEILDSGIITLADLELGVATGLAMRPPFGFMNAMGVARALDTVKAYANAHAGFPVPRCLSAQANAGTPFRIPTVLRRDEGDIAVLTIRRPQVLNALDEDVYAQIAEHATALKADPKIAAVVLTGFGPKAFVSGADVNFLARIATPDEGEATAARSKRAGDLLEQMGKPVVCALNGFAFGGGNELAMCCSARIVQKGLRVAVSQPEVQLGIIPGSGATQRLPRLVGIERAATMLRTGAGISSREAVEWGLVREEVEEDVVEAAVRLAQAVARGEVALATVDPRPMSTPERLPAAELGHLSRAIDALLCRAILEGCRMPLAEGLRFESKLFGQCCATEDMRIGLGNFIANGPKAKADFVHR